MSPDFFGKNCKIKGQTALTNTFILLKRKKNTEWLWVVFFFNLSSVVILLTIVFIVHPYDTKGDVINTERKKSGYFLLIQDEHISTFTGIFCVLPMLLSWRDHANEESFQLDSVFFTVLVRARWQESCLWKMCREQTGGAGRIQLFQTTPLFVSNEWDT